MVKHGFRVCFVSKPTGPFLATVFCRELALWAYLQLPFQSDGTPQLARNDESREGVEALPWAALQAM